MTNPYKRKRVPSVTTATSNKVEYDIGDYCLDEATLIAVLDQTEQNAKEKREEIQTNKETQDNIPVNSSPSSTMATFRLAPTLTPETDSQQTKPPVDSSSPVKVLHNPYLQEKSAKTAPHKYIDFDSYCLEDTFLLEALETAERVSKGPATVHNKKRKTDTDDTERKASVIDFDTYCLDDQLLSQALEESEAAMAQAKKVDVPIVSQVESSTERSQELSQDLSQSSSVRSVTPVKSKPEARSPASLGLEVFFEDLEACSGDAVSPS